MINPAVFICCLALTSLTAFAQTLPEKAREHGGSARTVFDIASPIARPAELMSESDLVVNGRVTSVTIRLNEDQTDVVTEYTIAPIQALKQRRIDTVAEPGAATKIVVRQFGGTLVTADGLHLSTSVNIFPESESFRVGEEVLVFIKSNADTKTYRFTGGAFGAYRIQNGLASSMTERAAKRRGDQPVSASVFFADLLRAR